MTPKTAVVVLAGGTGARMRSALPKVLHLAAGRPLLDRVLETARAVAPAGAGGLLVVVTGPGAGNSVASHVRRIAPEAALAGEPAPAGTGGALRAALPCLGEARRVAVLPGDAPLLSSESVRRLLEELDARPDAPAAFLTATLADPSGYGRVLRDAKGTILAVVEEADASEREKEIREVNGGVYAFDRAFLEAALTRLEPADTAGRLPLTDIVAMAVESGRPARGLAARSPEEILGVNARSDLARVEGILRARAAAAAMAAGATLLRPETVTLDDTVTLAADSFVEPFARLREGTELLAEAHVGNFVETKKARLGRGAKANHLTYLGDAEVGEGTNVGAGVITCNYDGFTKHRTTIGRGVFVGSDVQLVAPVTVGDGAVVGAGTTVTQDVPPDALVTSRAPLRTTEGGGAAYREKKRPKKSR